MSWSCPFHSFQLPLHVPVFSRYVRFIFHVCPVLLLSHFSTSPVVPIGFLVLCFPFMPPALPLLSFLSLSCPFQFPFVSLSFPPSFPCTSLHFPFAPQYFPQKNTVFPAFSQRGRQKRQESQTSKEPAGGVEPGTPVCDTGSPKTTGGYPLSSLRCPTRRAMSAEIAGHAVSVKAVTGSHLC